MELLATSVPGQVKSFIQYLIVNVCINCGFELLRVARVTINSAGSRTGPSLREDDGSVITLKPHAELEEMDYPTIFSEIVLYCILACIAPIMSYVMIIMFSILLITFKSQFIFNGIARNDPGGVLWSRMIKLTIF